MGRLGLRRHSRQRERGGARRAQPRVNTKRAEQQELTRSGHRPLHVIADEIGKDWQSSARWAAQPYIDAMRHLNDITDRYGLEDAIMIVCYFLNNATTWRGETARRIKAELKAIPGVSPK